MKNYRCKCGRSTGFGSDTPSRCFACRHCGSDMAYHPKGHRDPIPHEFAAQMVETDEGPKPLSHCLYCHRTQAELDKLAALEAKG